MQTHSHSYYKYIQVEECAHACTYIKTWLVPLLSKERIWKISDEKVSDKNACQLCIKKNKKYSLICIHLVSENVKKKITLQSASSFPFPVRVSLCFLSLSVCDGLCWGQTESPAAGRLQTIVLIPFPCSLPTCLTNTNIYTAAHLLSPQGCHHKRSELQTRGK